MLSYLETTIHEINDPRIERSGVTLLVKREDLNHPFVTGNKWWKLKYNLEEAINTNTDCVVTFGGAYSNHVYATAAAARELGLKSVGLIRGEKTPPLNPTLSFAEECGMELHYVSRNEYRDKESASFLNKIKRQFGNCYVIPEGGTNSLAIKGVRELARKIGQEVDYVCCAAGTGGTLAGLTLELGSSSTVLGFSILKGGFLKKDVAGWLGASSLNLKWDVIDDYHFGGYARFDATLLEFIVYQGATNQLPLEHVYTGKCLFGIYDLIRQGYFPKGSRILFLHTGGLQGRLRT